MGERRLIDVGRLKAIFVVSLPLFHCTPPLIAQLVQLSLFWDQQINVAKAALKEAHRFDRRTALAHSDGRVANQDQTDLKLPIEIEAGWGFVHLEKDLDLVVQRIGDHLQMVVAAEANATDPVDCWFPTEKSTTLNKLQLDSFQPAPSDHPEKMDHHQWIRRSRWIL